MLSPITIPGLFVTGTDTGIGKTVVSGAIANWFYRQGYRTAVCKPVATGCAVVREGLVSEDAEFLAACAESTHPLDLICPQCFVDPLAPAVASARAKIPIAWDAVDRSLKIMTQGSQVIIVEGVGGILVPMDEKHTVLDIARWLKLPTIIVARPSLGTINHTLLTIRTLKEAGVKIAGVVINRYPTDSVDLATETNPRAIEQFGKVPVLTIVPDEKVTSPVLPPGIVAAIDQVDWLKSANMR